MPECMLVQGLLQLKRAISTKSIRGDSAPRTWPKMLVTNCWETSLTVAVIDLIKKKKKRRLFYFYIVLTGLELTIWTSLA